MMPRLFFDFHFSSFLCLLSISLLGACILEGPPALHAPGQDPDLEARTQFHVQLMTEMAQVVLLKEVRSAADRQEMSQWVSALNSGASVEGVYNGLTHSDRFRALEKAHPRASSQALAIFVKELDYLQKQLPEATLFTAESAKPLPLPAPLGKLNAQQAKKLQFSSARTFRGKEAYTQLFAQSSFFTLKRVLGEESLKLLTYLKTQPQRLNIWYGGWVKRLNGHYSIDFGLELRNRKDAAFHQSWAEGVHRDLLSWELLNRYHRVLNAAQDQSLSKGPGKHKMGS